MNGTAHDFRAKSRVGFSATLITVASFALLLVMTCAVPARAQDLDDVSFSGTVADTTRTVTGGTLAREEVERLPVFTRTPLDLVFLLGGVTEEPLAELYF